MSALMSWPRPPACLPHDQLDMPPNGARIAVAGLVLVRQRPGTAKGVIFITLEDETGVANIIVWPKTFEKYRKIVLSARVLGVRGRVQRKGLVIHVVAEHLIDMSDKLALLSDTHGDIKDTLARADEVKRPGEDPREITIASFF